MAKQLVNPIERHAEKGVLGLTGLVLIGVMARYLVTSPNRIEIGGEMVTPAAIDSKLSQKALDVREKIKAAKSPEAAADLLLPQWNADPFQDGSVRAESALAVAVGPEVPMVDLATAIEGNAKLAEVVPLGKLAAAFGRSTFKMVDSGTKISRNVPGNWVTVSVLFDVKTQREFQRREYGAGRAEVVFGPPQLQRRARRPDGTWSEEDWRLVEAWPAVSGPEPPTITLVQEAGQRVVSKEQRVAVDKFLSDLHAGEVQLSLLRPLMVEFPNGTPWKFPSLSSERDVIAQDQEYLPPPQDPSAPPVDRYGLSVATTGGPAVAQTPAQLLAQSFTEIEHLMERAKANLSSEDAIKAFNKAQEIMDTKEASSSDKEKAAKLRAKAEQLDKDIKRAIIISGGPRGQLAPKATPGPTQQERRPTQQLWIHDAKPGSVRSGQTYQYRLRVCLFNRLAGDPKNFARREDATVVYVYGDWSEPSDPISVPMDAEFFVATPDERNEQVGVDFFRWYDGVWVKSGREKFAVGQLLAAETRCAAPSIEDRTVPDNPLVPFEADARIVALDFKRSLRDRKEAKKSTGVVFGAPTSQCSVVLVDSEGQLHERFEVIDKADPHRRELSEKVWKAPRNP